MTVYVDWLMHHGWILHGRAVMSCHLLSDQLDLQELHDIAKQIGLERRWFQCKPGSAPHYDLVASKRELAIAAGAVAVDNRTDWVTLIRPIVRGYRANEYGQTVGR